jgi:ribosome-associated toxin RatA of RatAB toxin-antitoxin module
MKSLKLMLSWLLLSWAGHVEAQSIWKLSEEKDGVKIYTRPIENSKINAIKVEFNLSASPEQLAALLMDIEHSDEWLYHCKYSRVIKSVSRNEFYYYTQVSVPWPVKDRDFVSHCVIQQNPKSKVITIDAPAIGGMVPEDDNLVRITKASSKWTLYPDGMKNTKVNYELEVDPGGSIPAWLVNLFSSQGPVESYKKLKLQINKPQYKNAAFSFL